MSEIERNTEQKILEAAEEVFVREGFDGARMQGIADAAGINKALLHYYYRSKDRLFELVFQHKMKQFIPQISAALNDPEMPFLDKIDQFILAYLGMMRQNPRLPVFIVTTINRHPDFARIVDRSIGSLVITAMQQEIKKGNIRPVDPHQFLLTLVGMCIFPFLARPIFSGVFQLDKAEYDKILAERHLHVMQFARSILTVG
jgi:TetR/AcrR family transcriptional regulator